MRNHLTLTVRSGLELKTPPRICFFGAGPCIWENKEANNGTTFNADCMASMADLGQSSKFSSI